MKVLTIDQLCKIIPKKPESISSDMTRKPESLPPWFKLPGSKTPLKAGMSAKAAGLGFDEFHHWSASAGNYAGESECRSVWKTLQFIPPESGDKLNLPGASFNDGFFTVGEITDRVYIVEGIGQAWACNKATGAAAVSCFGAGRMMTVASALREKHPAARLVIVPDKGKEIQAAEIAAAVSGAWVTMPPDKPANYDANDFAAENGHKALADLLERPQSPPMRYKLLIDADLSKLPPLQWRIKGVLPIEGLAAWYGASGSGKSFLVLDALQAVAAGADWFGHRVTPCPVVYCALEGEGGIAGRVAAYRIRHGSTAENIRYLVQAFSLLESGDIHERANLATECKQRAGSSPSALCQTTAAIAKARGLRGLLQAP